MSKQSYIVVHRRNNGTVRFVSDTGLDLDPRSDVSQFRIDPLFDHLVDFAEPMYRDVAEVVAHYASRRYSGDFTIEKTTEARRKYRGVNVNKE